MSSTHWSGSSTLARSGTPERWIRWLRVSLSCWSAWRAAVSREKATLSALNMIAFDIRRKVFIAEGWVPTASVGALRLALRRASARRGNATSAILTELTTPATPPTYLRTNKFTAGFQGLVDTYGIPRYQEINPGAFAVILFPFLFAIMFGDVGHGFLLLLIALYFIANEV